jgi:hypothetical protein
VDGCGSQDGHQNNTCISKEIELHAQSLFVGVSIVNVIGGDIYDHPRRKNITI